MGRVVVTEFVTLDGVMEDPGGGEKSPYGGWAFQFERGEAGDRFKLEELMAADALLLGRRTYEGFAAAWPSMNEDEFGRKMNSMPKFVASLTLDRADWNATIIPGNVGGEIESLKAQPGGDLLIYGSGTLVDELTRRGLIDEYRLMFHPVVVGAGKKLFETAPPTTLRLADKAVTDAGVAVLTYTRAAE